ncbi:MAG: 50S ribosomal protein L20 [Patescibacteria group bacterium]|jgi:large subunit ribosomal protein L20
MARVKRGVAHVKRRKNILKRAKGFGWKRKNTLRAGKTAIVKAGVHAYVGRKLKKRDYRALWQTRLGAAVRPAGLSYSAFIAGLKQANIELDRKVLSTLAADHPKIFAVVVREVKAAIKAHKPKK